MSYTPPLQIEIPDAEEPYYPPMPPGAQIEIPEMTFVATPYQPQPSASPEATPRHSTSIRASTLLRSSSITSTTSRRLTLSDGQEVAAVKKSLATDPKTPAEYTLHILFTQFVRHAERKLNLCLNYPLDTESPVVELLAEGVDPEFDSIIASLGYIARRKPKPVIDSVMFWRKSKSEVSVMAANAVEKNLGLAKTLQQQLHKSASPSPSPSTQLSLLKRHTSRGPSRAPSVSSLPFQRHKRNNSSKSSINSKNITDDTDLTRKQQILESQLQTSRETAVQADRKSLVSIYILCRVLIEVIKQTPTDAIGDDLGDKLEEIVYTQLKTTDPQALGSLIRSANWNLFAELLGHMSEKRFLSVSDRFIADLEKIPQAVAPGDEPRLQLLIHGMRYLRMTNYPLDCFEDSAEFLQSVSKFYSRCANEAITATYSEVLTHLLLSLADVLTAEANHPTWVAAVSAIYTRSSGLAALSGPWTTSFTLLSSSLAVAPKEIFSANWMKLIETHSAKLKPKTPLSSKAVYVTALARLMWVFLYRCPESLNQTVRCFDQLYKMLNLTTTNRKQQWLTADLALLQPLVQLLRAVGFSNLTYALEDVLLPMFRSAFSSGLEGMAQERLLLVIRSYVSILADMEAKQRPPFPTDEVIASVLHKPRTASTGADFFVRGSHNAVTHEEFCKHLAQLFLVLDASVGANSSESTQKLSTAPFASFHFGSDSNVQTTRNLNTELFASVLEVVPWCLTGLSSLPFKKLVDILLRNAIHSDVRVSTAATNTLRALASRRNPTALVTTFAQLAFCLEDTPHPAYMADYSTSTAYQRLLTLYVDLLQCWLAGFESTDDAVDSEMPTNDIRAATERRRSTDELEWKSIANVIEELEGNGLFFLCSHDSSIRHLGVTILRIVTRFDDVIFESTTSEKVDRSHRRSSSKFAADVGVRIIDVLEDADFVELIEPVKESLSMPERSKIAKLVSKPRRDTLLRLAESDYGVDTAIWFRLFPQIVVLCFERSPVSVALCRSIVCGRLVQIHETVCLYADARSGARSFDFPPEILVQQWKLYLVFACCALTSTSEDTLAVVPRSRKPARITSAVSIFKMVIPLLRSDQMLVRDAVISGLSSVNLNVFRNLLESFGPVISAWESQSAGEGSENRMKVEMTHILQNVTTRARGDALLFADEWTVSKLVDFLTFMTGFLHEQSVQVRFEFQTLRRYFCRLLENVYTGVAASERTTWFPFAARVRCYGFLEEWCGYGQYAQLSHERYNFMVKQVTAAAQTGLNAAIEIERGQLEYASVSCMAALCADIADGAGAKPASFDIPDLLAWIGALLSSGNDRIHEQGRRALQSVVASADANMAIIDHAIRQCYVPGHPEATESYFITLADAIVADPAYPCSLYQLLPLALFCAASDTATVRHRAARLLVYTEQRFYAGQVDDFSESICCETKAVYKRAFFNAATSFAAVARESFKIISELTMVFHIVEPRARRDVLAILLPWVQAVELQAEDGVVDVKSQMVLNNLFEITVKYSDVIQNEVEALWVALGNGHANNTGIVLRFLTASATERRKTVFVEYARSVVVYLAFTQTGSAIVETLIANLEPKAMIPPHPKPVERVQSTSDLPYIADLGLILNQGKEAVLSLGQVSLVFLVDLLAIPSEIPRAKVPLLLHVAFALLDHYLPVVQQQAAEMVAHVLYTLARDAPRTKETIALLRQGRSDSPDALRVRALWVYDDLHRDRNGATTPKSMDSLVRATLAILQPTIPSLQDEWSRVSLVWSTTCAVRHIACRSFQVFRSLLSFLDQGMLRDMLHRLSNTISDETPDIQGFAMQILMTLNAICAELDSAQLIEFPQLFWSGVACLSTVHEPEFLEVLSALSKFISKIDLDSQDTVNCLVSTFPPKWEGKFEGLQPLVMVGLRSAASHDAALRFLDRLNRLQDSEIIAAGSSRLLLAVLANLPRMLHAMDAVSPELAEATATMVAMCERFAAPDLSRLLTSYAKGRFRSKKDFVAQIVAVIRKYFFPQYEAQTLVVLLGFLSNNTRWVKLETMELLKSMLPYVDFQREEFLGVGADLISPLLRLLLSDYAGPALEVLDEASSISGSQLDKAVLRMSLGNHTIRKEYEKTATLFGIPDETGWAIPMPAVTAATTRNNVHAVFSTCVVAAVETAGGTEEIEFHTEDYAFEDVASVTEEPDALSHMWAALDSFDSFFARDSPTAFDAPQMYDKNVSQILNRSLARTPSNTSFKQSLADSFDGPLPAPVQQRMSYIPFRSSRRSPVHPSFSPHR